MTFAEDASHRQKVQDENFALMQLTQPIKMSLGVTADGKTETYEPEFGNVTDTGDDTGTIADTVDSRVDSDNDIQDVIDASRCATLFETEVTRVLECFSFSPFAKERVVHHLQDEFSFSRSQLSAMQVSIAEAESVSRLDEECVDHVLGKDQQWMLDYKARKAASNMALFLVDLLEDPDFEEEVTGVHASPGLANVLNQSLSIFDDVCDSTSDDIGFVATEACTAHIDMEKFVEEGLMTRTCSKLESSALLEHHRSRSQREHHRAKLVHLFHAQGNSLGLHYQHHLRHGRHERHIGNLIAQVVLRSSFTAKQQELLAHVERGLPMTVDCEVSNGKGDHQRSLMLQIPSYKEYIDCLCSGKQFRVVCEARLLSKMSDVHAAVHQRHKELLEEQRQHQTPSRELRDEGLEQDRSTMRCLPRRTGCLPSSVSSSSCLRQDSWELSLLARAYHP